jgi:hypothetical protein
MGLSNTKSSWLCSDCSGRMSTIDEVHGDLAPVRGIDQVIADYEITEFERCDEISISSPASYSNTLSYSKITVNSPLTPNKSNSLTSRTKVISRNAFRTSVNLVNAIRSESMMSNKPI